MFKDKKILIFGAGVSGVGVAAVLADEGAETVIYDENLPQEKQKSLTEQNIPFLTGPLTADFLSTQDFMILSPGVSIYSKLVERAGAVGVKVLAEVEVAARLFPGKLIAITGTNGKTTTTMLLGQMLGKLPVKSAVGGNIGDALSVAAKTLPAKNDILLAEISSFQMESVDTFHPNIAAVLNLTPDHLDRHRTFAEYKRRKEAVFARQTPDDYLVLNFDDTEVKDMAERAKARTVFFSGKQELPEGAFLQNNIITIFWQGEKYEVCPTSAMQIFGAHNVENALAASICAFLAGVPIADIRNVLENFEGVEHRLEYVATVAGVPYYNDSKATNPESAVKALEAFAGNIVLIAGGKDKLTDLSEFMALAKEKTSLCIFLGEARERFSREAQTAGVGKIFLAGTFEEAVEKAHSFAKPPQVVLLSPACSSFDMFNNFPERGRYFKQLVKTYKSREKT